MAALVLGPVLRYVDASQATVWVQADAPCEVEVLGRRARTFEVDGHHFAIVAIEGLSEATPYEVALDGQTVWPPRGAPFPPSIIRPVAPGGGLRLAFGSCREVAPHVAPFALDERQDSRAHGIDALRSYALELARADEAERPDALLMLGDQLYADEPPRRLAKALRDRETRPNGSARAQTFAEYALLYRESWSDPAVRWLLSTVPSMMIFDDHEILDEWKISQAWVDDRAGDLDYERRVTAGLMAYWVFQHVGNLSPGELAANEVLERARRADGATAVLRRFARDADRQVEGSRWSFSRDLGDARLVVLDSRAARRLEPGDRRIIDDPEWAWAVERVREAPPGGHVLLASSLPVMLPAALHDFEAAVERLADGAWGKAAARLAERLRQGLNLGHWANFQTSFSRMAQLLDELATAEGRGCALVLSGDVHHGYLARWHGPTPVWQIVCSPLRKRVERHEHALMRLAESRVAARAARALARASGAEVRPPAWEQAVPPRYCNQIAVLELDGRRAHVALRTPEGSDWREPRLRTLWQRVLAG